MRVAGIIAEYNPFHNGHAYHIARSRRLTNADAVIVIMSGAFTQRGEAAILDKWTRAEMALKNGADMVIELPCLFALREARGFAEGGGGEGRSVGEGDGLGAAQRAHELAVEQAYDRSIGGGVDRHGSSLP